MRRIHEREKREMKHLRFMDELEGLHEKVGEIDGLRTTNFHMKKAIKATGPGKAEAHFSVLDTDGDGQVTKEEWVKFHG